ncbi:MAG: hypothetical protein OEV93_02510 [Candidatus Moranbacteria bacterium]|nr:hypothetical protein [Candidatus Moranbacteria bacterium]
MTKNNCCASGSESGCGCGDSNSGGCECGGDVSNIAPNKMCHRTSKPFGFNVEEIKKLTSNPKFICGCCGRTANDKEDLCSPNSLN